jgi:hypothetical protein
LFNSEEGKVVLVLPDTVANLVETIFPGVMLLVGEVVVLRTVFVEVFFVVITLPSLADRETKH